MVKPFVVETSVHGMPSIRCEDLPKELCEQLNRIMVSDSSMYNEAYLLRSAAGAFLQSYSINRDTGFVMIEFWKKDYQSFVDYINNRLGLV